MRSCSWITPVKSTHRRNNTSYLSAMKLQCVSLSARASHTTEKWRERAQNRRTAGMEKKTSGRYPVLFILFCVIGCNRGTSQTETSAEAQQPLLSQHCYQCMKLSRATACLWSGPAPPHTTPTILPLWRQATSLQSWSSLWIRGRHINNKTPLTQQVKPFALSTILFYI